MTRTGIASWLALSGCGAGSTAPAVTEIIEDAGLEDADSDASGFACTVAAPRACPEPAPGFGDVSPIFEQHCVPCHAGAVDGPWQLREYQHVADWQEIIRADLLACTMPPPDSGPVITVAERLAILTWIRCGVPQ